jgi:DNA processing protein
MVRGWSKRLPKSWKRLLLLLSRWGRELASRLQGLAVASPQETASEADPSRRALLDALGYGPVALDDLAGFTGKTVADLTSVLLMLELDGQVEALPGNRYQRLPG